MVKRWGSLLLVFVMVWTPLVALALWTRSIPLWLAVGIPATVLLWWIAHNW